MGIPLLLIVILTLLYLLYESNRRNRCRDCEALSLSDEPPLPEAPDSFCDSGCCR